MTLWHNYNSPHVTLWHNYNSTHVTHVTLWHNYNSPHVTHVTLWHNYNSTHATLWHNYNSPYVTLWHNYNSPHVTLWHNANQWILWCRFKQLCTKCTQSNTIWCKWHYQLHCLMFCIPGHAMPLFPSVMSRFMQSDVQQPTGLWLW